MRREVSTYVCDLLHVTCESVLEGGGTTVLQTWCKNEYNDPVV